ncbi:hypothetical protein PanWU01x14_192150 [Parasponia andersonii]|uniref:RNase H type-1 domain-containing protein n=1 Tax=Parasponia andersonii TaxID=3476 RepID=A0A2P5C1F9_PARAD|nr:hypothetical protein PanWU01x14_192150 [Parasponia andersonii]
MQKRVGSLACGVIFALWQKKYHYEELILRLFVELSTNDFEAIVVVIWILWNEKNNVVYGTGCRRPDEVHEGAGRLLFEFQYARLKIDGDIAQQNKPLRVKWCCPSTGKLKLNIDTTVDQRLGRVGVGAMIRDCNGHAIDVLARLIPIFISPFGAN